MGNAEVLRSVFQAAAEIALAISEGPVQQARQTRHLPQPSGPAGRVDRLREPHVCSCVTPDPVWASRAHSLGSDSIGIRGRLQPAQARGMDKLIEDFGRGSPAECLAGSAVEGERDRVEVVAGVSDKVGALREVLA